VPTAESETTAQSEKADVGVLFVHGIGQPAQKGTLRSFAEPICRWIESRITSVDPTDFSPEILVVERPLPHDGVTPAHADVEFQRNEGAKPVRWLLAESWWARDIGSPTFRELLTWGWRAIPWTIGSHCAKRVDASRRALTQGVGLRRLFLALALTYELVLSLVMLVVALALVVASTLLGFLALLPVPFLKNWLRGIQGVISSSVGDSYALVAHRLGGRGAILGRLAHDVRWLSSRCTKLVVVAHSQGAAAAHLALRTRHAPKVDLLLTFGSGLRKLEELQRSRHTTAASMLPWLLGLLLTVFLCRQLLVSVLGGSAGASVTVVVAQLLLVSLTMYAASHFLSKELEAELKERLLKIRDVVPWKDCYATHDPVPNGELFAESGFSTIVSNRASWFFDHTSYWRNRDEFVGFVASEILARHEGTDSLALSDGHRAKVAAQRARRVRCLTVGRLIVLLSSVLVGWFAWEPLSTLVLPLASRACISLGLGYADSYSAWVICLLALLIVLPALSCAVSQGAWSFWDTLDSNASTKVVAYNVKPIGRLVYGGVTAGVLVLHVLSLVTLMGVEGWLMAVLVAIAVVILSLLVVLFDWRHRKWLLRRARRDSPLPEFSLGVPRVD
jgi:hypothetical protein